MLLISINFTTLKLGQLSYTNGTACLCFPSYNSLNLKLFPAPQENSCWLKNHTFGAKCCFKLDHVLKIRRKQQKIWSFTTYLYLKLDSSHWSGSFSHKEIQSINSISTKIINMFFTPKNTSQFGPGVNKSQSKKKQIRIPTYPSSHKHGSEKWFQ